MNIGRGYHSNAVLMDGSVFVMGGSWFDGKGVAEFNVFFTPILGWLLHILRYKVFDWLFTWLFPWPRKDGELWNPITNEWRVLENVKCEGSVVTDETSVVSTATTTIFGSFKHPMARYFMQVRVS